VIVKSASERVDPQSHIGKSPTLPEMQLKFDNPRACVTSRSVFFPFGRLRSGHFEGQASVRRTALPEDNYLVAALARQLASKPGPQLGTEFKSGVFRSLSPSIQFGSAMGCWLARPAGIGSALAVSCCENAIRSINELNFGSDRTGSRSGSTLAYTMYVERSR